MSAENWGEYFSGYFGTTTSTDHDRKRSIENLKKLRDKYKRKYTNFIVNLAQTLRLLYFLLV